MAHRAKQVLDAVEAALSSGVQATVEVNRARALSDIEGELPALEVNYTDLPDDSDLGSWHRVLDVALTAYATADTEREVTEALFDIQSQAHVAMVGDLGLDFVWEVALGEIPAPTIQQADRVVGALTSRWAVRYILNISNPG